jgi:xylulokinase
MTRVLAVDVGTSAVKVALVTDGDVVAAAAADHPLSAPRAGWAEQHPDDWWRATVRAANLLRGRTSFDDIDAVAVTGQMQDLVCLDGDGSPVRPAILYSDVRAAAEHERLGAELGPAWAAAIGATPDPSHVAAKWRWLVDHEPDHVGRTRTVVFGAAGAVVHRLTGVACCDPSTAATTGLYELDRRRWWPPAVDALGVPVPAITDVGAVAGALSAAAADTIGAVAGTPVVHANGDAVATTIGVCGTLLDRPYAYLGTSGWVAVSTAQPRRVPGVIVLPGLAPRHWVAAAQLSVVGAAPDWAREHLLGGVTHPELDALAAEGGCAAADGVLFVPTLDGTRAAPSATGVLLGVRRATAAATIAAAVVEGVAHAVRQLLMAVAPGAGELAVCGGASRSPALVQAVADVTGCQVVRVTAEHAAVLGAATAAHLALGAPVPTPPPAGDAIRPDEARAAVHRRVASTFDAVLPTMTPLLISLGEVRAHPREDPS